MACGLRASVRLGKSGCSDRVRTCRTPLCLRKSPRFRRATTWPRPVLLPHLVEARWRAQTSFAGQCGLPPGDPGPMTSCPTWAGGSVPPAIAAIAGTPKKQPQGPVGAMRLLWCPTGWTGFEGTGWGQTWCDFTHPHASGGRLGHSTAGSGQHFAGIGQQFVGNGFGVYLETAVGNGGFHGFDLAGVHHVVGRALNPAE